MPFALSNWQSVGDIWAGLAQDRFTTNGLVKHLLTYPFETFGCLLPWSPLLLSYARPSVRRSIATNRPGIQFLIVALVATYPSVWLAAGARGRYYMPLYPCLAILMGLIVEHLTAQTASSTDRRGWRMFERGTALAALATAVVMLAANFLSIPSLRPLEQPPLFLWILVTSTLVATCVIVWASFGEQTPRPQVALVAMAAFAGLAYVGAAINVRVAGGNDLRPAVAELKERLPDPEHLVSLGRIYHRFAYCYEMPIRQVDWPTQPEQLPADVTYFCFDRRPGDTSERRGSGDDRLASFTCGTLPFEWDEVAEIPCDPVKRSQNHRTVVIGRVRSRGDALAKPDASRPGLR